MQQFLFGSGGVDSNAAAFIAAAGITDATQKSAINKLVGDLKKYGLWTKMKAVYPIVGGTATSHKWNLKNPLDTDAAFRLVFSGGWTHASTGALSNGTNGYANTFLNVDTILNLNSAGLSLYSRTNEVTNYTMGAAAWPKFFILAPRLEGDLMRIIINNGAVANDVANTNSQGFFMGCRISSTQERAWKNNTILQTFNVNSTAKIPLEIFFGAFNNIGSPEGYGSKEFAFVAIHDGLTNQNASDFYSAIVTFETTLGRNV